MVPGSVGTAAIPRRRPKTRSNRIRRYGASSRSQDRPWAKGVDDLRRCQTARIDSVRIDQWLQAVRITKTRSGAAAACRGGHVRINGAAARPSSRVAVGDHVEARVNQRERIVDVTKLITKRVDAATAAECFDDRSPLPPESDDTFQPPFAVRDSGAGRPTKRDRRQIDRVRRRGR